MTQENPSTAVEENNHPAKIAKYLLKGWSLLNDYCPNGLNIPIVKSHDGRLVCTGCSPSCPHYSTHGGDPPVPAPAPAVGAGGGVAIRADPWPAEPILSHERSAAPRVPEPPPSAPMQESPPAAVARKPTAADSRGASSGCPPGNTSRVEANTVEVALQGPGLAFGCVRLDFASNGRPRLAGDHCTVKARLALPEAYLAAELEAFQKSLCDECRLMGEHVLLPDVQMRRQEESVSIGCEDGTSFLFPTRDCMQLQTPCVTPSTLAASLWNRVVLTPPCAALRTRGAKWLEVSVINGQGLEASFRKAWETESGLPPTKPPTYDW